MAALLAAGPAGGQSSGQGSLGTWRNPQNSVHVKVHRCGDATCGTVVWANEKAKADARRGGTDPLVGVQLFQDFRPAGKDVWRGRVYVPDIGKTFSGTVTRIDDRTLVGKGCLLGGLGCRSQTWSRID
ncbi:DUF2147 domain-containing protein [Sphingomonas canadensis]|nr:DUF2147 domain-containing protein [Sphingomonas canadensis]